MTAPLYFTFRDGKYRASVPPPKRDRPRTPREEENVALSCLACNLAKGRRTPEEWQTSA